MRRSPVKVAPRLILALAAALVVQVLVAAVLVPQHGASWLLAAAAALVCFFGGLRLLRRALSPLLLEAVRLQETAIGWEPGRIPSTPSSQSEPALQAVGQLRRKLFERLEESRRLRLRAEQASQYKTDFLRSVQHELRTPLNSILGFTDVLLSGIEGPLTEGQRENLAVIRSTGKRLDELFDEVIELASTAAGAVQPEQQAVDVAALLERVGEGLETARGDKPVHIAVEAAADLPLVRCDAARVQSLLLGIGSQALSVLQGPLLALSAGVAGTAVQLSVRDPMRRLTSEELRSLLGTERSAVRRKGVDEASRQRLAIWRQHAQLLGGGLALVSDERGTAFVLELPSARQSL